MKILIMSDTHGRLENAKKVLDLVMPQGVKEVLHCGDYMSDAKTLEKLYPDAEFHSIHGNCDVGFGGANDQVVVCEGVPVYMTHGHRYGVKWGEYDELIIDAKAHGARIAVCGHTHVPYLQVNEEILVMNPGSLSLPRDSQYPSYGIIELEAGRINQARILQVLEDGSVRLHPSFKDFTLKST